MSFKFKISKRLALIGGAALAPLTLGVCGTDHIADPSLTPPDSTSTSAVTSVTVTPDSDSTVVGGAVQLTAAAHDASGSVLKGVAVLWASADSAIATVDPTGLVRGVAPGGTSVSATSGSVSGSARIVITPNGIQRPGYYASPRGSSVGDGTLDDPWDLATALAGGHGVVAPGDTIWLRGGTYRGAFRSTVAGTPDARVVVRPYPAERVVIDGAGATSAVTRGDVFVVAGPWTEWRDLEFMSSDPNRTSDTRPNLVVNDASHTRYVGLVAHDGGIGFYNYPSAADVLVANGVFYNNGWQEPNGGHGHGLYLRSNAGPVTVRNNVIFNQFGYGIHVYTDLGGGQLINVRLEGNVAFNNGTASESGPQPNILVGGNDYADQDVVVDNVTYFSPSVPGTNVIIGWHSTINGQVLIRGNHFAGGDLVLDLGHWQQMAFEDNTLVGSARVIRVQDTLLTGYRWARDRQYRDPLSFSWMVGPLSLSWLGWQTATGLGLEDLVSGSPPAGSSAIVRASPSEPGRAVVAVYNWTRQSSVLADLTGVLEPGDRYEIHNVQDLFGAPIAEGTYGGGTVAIPMSGVVPPAPVGAMARAPQTAPEFDAFIVRRRTDTP